MKSITTDRLVLRRWDEGDREAFHALNADPAVMATIGPVMSRAESDAFMNRIEARFDEHGFGLWCVTLDDEPIGFTGLMIPWFREGVEIGWRLRSERWGNGYASEAARGVMHVAFEQIELDELISFTASINVRSRRVMDKIGLVYDPAEDFDHPSVSEGSPLRPHVLYRISRASWLPFPG